VKVHHSRLTLSWASSTHPSCSQYCGILALSMNCGTWATAVASQRFWNNICFQAKTAKQTTKQRPLLGKGRNNRRAVFSLVPCWGLYAGQYFELIVSSVLGSGGAEKNDSLTKGKVHGERGVCVCVCVCEREVRLGYVSERITQDNMYNVNIFTL
jgi:hypothetical protein